MSTRIYNGFRLETQSLAEALRMVQAFRPWVEAQANQRFDSFVENLSNEGMEMGQAYDLWCDRREKVRVTGSWDPAVDTDFSLSLIPVSDGILGIVYTAHKEWCAAWMAQPGVTEYGYWNNSDAPDGVSELDWEAREKAWSVLTNDAVSMQAFSIEVMNPTGPRPKAWRS